MMVYDCRDVVTAILIRHGTLKLYWIALKYTQRENIIPLIGSTLPQIVFPLKI